MSRRFSLAIAFVLSLFASLAFAAGSTLSGLRQLSLSPPNAYGSFDGVATFNGAMPTARSSTAFAASGSRCRDSRTSRSRCCAGPSRRSSMR
jgi:hypothetical protein